jgi:aminoglycoside 6'-N-acetyltransferase I
VIVDLTRDARDHVEQAAALLHAAFLHRTEDWQDLASALQEVHDSLTADRISRVAVDDTGQVLGWIGAIPSYAGRVWEIHPLVVSPSHRRMGVGRALVDDIEQVVATRGGLTLWLGSDDENGETTAAGIDLYADVAGAIQTLKTLRGEHPFEFYQRLGFHVMGFLPDANGRGKPDIFFAKRVGDWKSRWRTPS